MQIRIIFFSLLLIATLFNNLSSQEDQSTFKVTYHQTLDFYKNSSNPSDAWNALNYVGDLFFDGNVSTYYYGQGGNGKTKVGDDYNVRILYNDAKGFVFHQNPTTDRLTSRDYISDKAFVISESLPKINWQLKNDHKEIGGYACQLAVGEFRGRVYEAWFTNEIPISTGPWKLGGLPGLILEARDRQGQVEFHFASLSFEQNPPANWTKGPNAGQRITYDDFVALRKRKTEETFAKLAASNPNLTITVGEYKGIELEK